MKFRLNGSVDDVIRGSLNPFEWWGLKDSRTWTESFHELELIDWLMEHFPGQLTIYDGHIAFRDDDDNRKLNSLEDWTAKYLSGKIE
jgi:hypothetical protein